jgi:hypothetical protein
MSKATGGCFCGSVRYEIDGEIRNSTVCHCAGCRRASAAPALAWVTVSADSFEIAQGRLATIRGRKGEKGTCDGCGGERRFCPKCGTHITFVADDRTGEVDVTTGSLDNPDAFPPEKDEGLRSKIAWVKPFA